jgi:GT2 family glycosyltransferase
MKKRILIAIPSAGSIEPETFVSIYNMDQPVDIDTELKIFYGYLIDDVRNRIVDYAIEEKFDGILFIDSDMKLPKDTLIKLVNQNKDIISGLYIRKKEDKKIIELFLKNQYPNKDGKIMRNVEEFDILNKNIIEVDACGFGCVLVKTHVFFKIGYPYFKVIILDKNNITGEDIDFCIKAKNRNFKIHALADLKIGHIGKKEYNL